MQNSNSKAETTAQQSDAAEVTTSSQTIAKPNVSGLCRPKERAINCPNCGELHWESELRYSSQKSIVVSSGSLHSTLYGVCQKCADRHSR